MLWAPAAMAQSGPYVTASAGLATFDSSTTGNQAKSREAICAGYVLSDLIALEVSYFRIQEAQGFEDFPAPGISYTAETREKVSGFAFGPVFRWKLSEWATIFTKQSAVSIKDDESSVATYSPGNVRVSSNSNSTFSGYQPSVGINFRLTNKAPVSLGLELNRVFATSDRIKRITGIFVNLSYGL